MGTPIRGVGEWRWWHLSEVRREMTRSAPEGNLQAKAANQGVSLPPFLHSCVVLGWRMRSWKWYLKKELSSQKAALYSDDIKQDNVRK